MNTLSTSLFVVVYIFLGIIAVWVYLSCSGSYRCIQRRSYRRVKKILKEIVKARLLKYHSTDRWEDLQRMYALTEREARGLSNMLRLEGGCK